MIPVKLSWSKIHYALHATKDDKVIIEDVTYPIKMHSNGCRYINYTDTLLGKCMIMQQNKNKASSYAIRARNGETLTWVIPANGQPWELIETPVGAVQHAQF